MPSRHYSRAPSPSNTLITWVTKDANWGIDEHLNQTDPETPLSLEEQLQLIDDALNHAAEQTLKKTSKHKRKTICPLWQLDSRLQDLQGDREHTP
jgi:hypothetical protein